MGIRYPYDGTKMNNYDGYKQIGYPDFRYKLYFPIELNRYGIPAPYGIQLNASQDNKMVNHILKSIYQNNQKRESAEGIDDIFKDRLGLVRSKIELILLQLDQRKKINQEVLSQIEKDSCQAQNLIFALGYRAYHMDRDRLTLEKVKFDLEAQKRMEETSYFRDTGLLNKDLKDTLIQYLGEVQKSAFINDGREKI
jgi:hypothetical protein